MFQHGSIMLFHLASPGQLQYRNFSPSKAAQPGHFSAYVHKQSSPKKDGGGHKTAPKMLVLANSRQRLFSCSLIVEAAIQGTTEQVTGSRSRARRWACEHVDLDFQHNYQLR